MSQELYININIKGFLSHSSSFASCSDFLSILRNVGKMSLWFFHFPCVNLRVLVAQLGERE